MTLATAEWTSQVIAINVRGFSQEENPAMTTALQVTPQVGLASQNRSQSLIVPQNKITNLVRTIPIRSKLKMRFDSYCKKPSVSLMVLMVVSMSSFYSIDAFVSSKRTGTVPFLTPTTLLSPLQILHYHLRHIQVAQFR